MTRRSRLVAASLLAAIPLSGHAVGARVEVKIAHPGFLSILIKEHKLDRGAGPGLVSHLFAINAAAGVRSESNGTSLTQTIPIGGTPALGDLILRKYDRHDFPPHWASFDLLAADATASEIFGTMLPGFDLSSFRFSFIGPAAENFYRQFQRASAGGAPFRSETLRYLAPGGGAMIDAHRLFDERVSCGRYSLRNLVRFRCAFVLSK